MAATAHDTRSVDVSTISSAVEARHVQFSLTEATTVSPDDTVSDARALLRSHDFDTCPVVEDGHVIGLFVASSEPESGQRVRAVVEHLSPHRLASADTPLEILISGLQENPFIFIVSGRRITGFVTPADLGSPAARTFFYLKLAALEVSSADYVRSRYPRHSDALAQLSSGRRGAAEDLIKTLRNEDSWVDDIAALSLQDLVSILGKDDEFRSRLRKENVGWTQLNKGLVSLRNDVMHPSRVLEGASAAGVGRLSQKVKSVSLLTEIVLDLSNQRLEDRAG